MDMKKYLIFTLLSMFCFASFSCSKDERDPSQVTNKNNETSTENDSENKKVNEWIYSTMYSWYLWYDELSNKSKYDFTKDPEEFFDSLISDNDGTTYGDSRLVFSRIEKSETQTKTISGEDTYGFEFATYVSGGKYFGWVLYVLPGSPADKAGIKRGDWVVAKNSDSFNMTSYSDMLSGAAAKFLLADVYYDKTINTIYFSNSRTVSVEASTVTNASPIMKDTVLVADGKKIGYLMYNAFESGLTYKESDYDDEMKEVFKNFKSAGVSDFVLDLRYNGGGLVSSAQLLASLLAPSSALGKVFCKYTYNDKHTKENGSSYYYSNKESYISSGNLNLSRLVVLVGQTTASASEAVPNCLFPYMGRENVRIIGEQTIGKTVGSITFGEDEKYGYLLHPIVFHIYNSKGEADYANGFVPDEEVVELELGNELLPFGDPNETLLKAGIDWLCGKTTTSAEAKTKSFSDAGLKFKGYSFEGRRTEGLILDEK
jgi:C-terminal processing protease CtpA/Prc